MKLFQPIVFMLLAISFGPFCPVAMPQPANIGGTSSPGKTAKAHQEARSIEDKRHNDVIAGLDKMQRNIYADYEADRIACGTNYRTNAGCLKSAADKRDKRLAQNGQSRVQENAFHANQIQDIFASVGGGNPPTGDPGGSANPGDTPDGGYPGGNPGGASNPNGNRGGGNPPGGRNPGVGNPTIGRNPGGGSNGLTNCQHYGAPGGNQVVCDPPFQLLSALQAACLADNATTLICQSPPKLLYGGIEQRVPIQRAPIQGAATNKEYGKRLPAMKGETVYYGTDQNGVQRNITLSIRARAGHLVGEGIQGRVDLLSNPKVYNSASGHFESSTNFVIDYLWFDVNRTRPASIPAGGIAVPIGPQ